MSTTIEINPSSAIENSTTGTDEIDDDYEEVLVYVKFDDFDDVNFFFESEKIEIKNIEGPTPTCFVDNFKFAGKHNINLGSLLFFENKNVEANLISEFLGKSNTTLEFALRYIPVTPPTVYSDIVAPVNVVPKPEKVTTTLSRANKNKNKSSSSSSKIILDTDETKVSEI